jgi:hypothetical protein
MGKEWKLTRSNCSKIQLCKSSSISRYFNAYCAALFALVRLAFRCCSRPVKRIRTSNGSILPWRVVLPWPRSGMGIYGAATGDALGGRLSGLLLSWFQGDRDCESEGLKCEARRWWWEDILVAQSGS